MNIVPLSIKMLDETIGAVGVSLVYCHIALLVLIDREHRPIWAKHEAINEFLSHERCS